MRTRNGAARRGGFTLIELLVVISIILVLAALTAGAVIRVLVKGPELQARNEIDGLSQALGAFKAEFGVDHVPSHIILREAGYNPATFPSLTALEKNTGRYLEKVFGRRLTYPVNWSGRADWPANPTGVYELKGEECLTFFLGGIPLPAAAGMGCQGFSTDPTNPAGGGTRRGPFFEFKPARLFKEPSNPFYRYKDPFTAINKPAFYVYLSPSRAGNDYASDSRQGVQPYRLPSGAQFLNPNGFQIITAGGDGTFGPGGVWNPTTGYGPGQAGSDDFSNFTRGALLAPQS